MIDGVFDSEDWYAFSGTAGNQFRLALGEVALCVDLVAPDRVRVHRRYCGEFTSTLDATGTWYLRLEYVVPQKYAFAFTLDGSVPPAVLP